MTHRIPWILVVLASAGNAQELALWPRFQKCSVELISTTNMTQSIVVGKSAIRTKTELRVRELYEVTALKADGTATIRLTRTRIWGKITDKKGTVTFDTAADEEPPRAAEIWIDALPRQQVYEIRADGILLSVRTVADDGSLGDSDQHQRKTMQSMFVQAPELPLRVGATWEPEAGIHECTPTGCVAFATTNTLKAFDGKTVTIETRAVPPQVASTDGKHTPEMPITRQVVLSRKDGLPTSIRIAGKQVHKQRGASFETEVQMTAKRIVSKPK